MEMSVRNFFGDDYSIKIIENAESQFSEINDFIIDENLSKKFKGTIFISDSNQVYQDLDYYPYNGKVYKNLKDLQFLNSRLRVYPLKEGKYEYSLEWGSEYSDKFQKIINDYCIKESKECFSEDGVIIYELIDWGYVSLEVDENQRFTSMSFYSRKLDIYEVHELWNTRTDCKEE